MHLILGEMTHWVTPILFHPAHHCCYKRQLLSSPHLTNQHCKEHSLLPRNLVLFFLERSYYFCECLSTCMYVCISCVCLGLTEPRRGWEWSYRLLWTPYYIGTGNKPRSSAAAVSTPKAPNPPSQLSGPIITLLLYLQTQQTSKRLLKDLTEVKNTEAECLQILW